MQGVWLMPESLAGSGATTMPSVTSSHPVAGLDWMLQP